MRSRGLGLLLVFLLGACGGATTGDDAGASPADGGVDAALATDAAAALDAGAPDAGDIDAGSGSDGGELADPIGSIAGECGVLDDELTSPEPSYVADVVTYPHGWTIDMAGALSAGAQQILMEGTAGGTSGYSEAFAFEILHRCEGASFVKSETQIHYTTSGSITDILVEIGGERIGVSVTRAVNVTGMCTRDDTYSEAMATDLLTTKLNGIRESTMNVAPEDAWTKQILFVHADTDAAATAFRNAWEALDASLRADTIVYVSTSEGMDSFMYFQDRC